MNTSRANHPAKLEQGDDEETGAYLVRQGEAWADRPPEPPDGFELIGCTAEPRHWPLYTVIDDDFYDGPCLYCLLDAADDRHRGCEHAQHGRWRRWRITGKIAGWLYVTGITASGGSWKLGGGCNGCRTMPKLDRHPRVYVLGVQRDHWRCLLKGHHFPGEPIMFGYCGKCIPCPDCGSTARSCLASCPSVASPVSGGNT